MIELLITGQSADNIAPTESAVEYTMYYTTNYSIPKRKNALKIHMGA